MKEEDMVYTATIAFGKNLDYEALYYSDYMYGKEASTDDVWEYVEELKSIGSIKFKEKYAGYKMY